jgi:hypothetical protein
MAVRRRGQFAHTTSHFAILVQQCLKRPIADAPGDAEELVIEVLEVEDHDVGLAAVDGWMSAWTIDDELHPLLADAPRCRLAPAITLAG